MKKLFLISIVISLSAINVNYAQVKKYGKITIEELESNSDSQFKDANAIVLFKKRNSHYELDGQEGWTLITEVHERIKIFNKNGYDAATKIINYYTSKNNKENISIKATTYNLVNGKVSKTKLDKKNIFNKKETPSWSNKNFTMPNLKEGCIIEWVYKIRSPFYSNLNDIVFQYEIPIKYFHAKIKIPQYFIYKITPSNYYIVNVEKSKVNRTISLSFRSNDNPIGRGAITTKHSGEIELFENVYSLSLNNIKPIKYEPFISNLNNYQGSVDFELIGTKFPNSSYKNYSKDWNDVTKSIYELPDFGTELKKTTYFKDDLATILVEANTRDEKINAIFNFVKSKIKWNGYNSFVTNKGVKKAYKDGNGNAAEINLILTAMLREAGFDASPILISTRSHGIPLFPTREGFNYVIAGIELQDQIILLDATDTYSTPNVLPKRVLNWQGRIIRGYGSSAFINLFPNVYSLSSNKLNVKISPTGSIEGSLRSSYKNLNALTYRKEYNSLSEEELTKILEEKYQPIEIQKIRLGNKNNLDKPLGVSLQFNADDLTEIINDKIYFSPLFFLQEKENIFKSDTRKFPIDFATPWLTNYDVIIQIPDGYKVETLPENITINTENEIGEFSYSSSIKDNKIVLKIQTKINKPIIPYNLYIQLKEFYTKRILKQNEKIVLVKG